MFLHQFSDYYGMRSFYYSLGILPFHWNVTAWPVVGLQNLIIAWVLSGSWCVRLWRTEPRAITSS